MCFYSEIKSHSEFLVNVSTEMTLERSLGSSFFQVEQSRFGFYNDSLMGYSLAPSPRDEAKKLIVQREALEREIQALVDVLRVSYNLSSTHVNKRASLCGQLFLISSFTCFVIVLIAT